MAALTTSVVGVTAGWYPDSSGSGLRYFDGRAWTPSVAPPTQQAFPHMPSVTVTQPNHGLHAILTILTCGLWAPIWFVIAIAGSRRMRIQ